MRITSIIENTSVNELPVEHGLSLYIQRNDGKKILFDMGQSHLFADNAELLGLSISDVDIAIISHGHYDHGGGLKTFLDLNQKAKVYVQEKAFLPHYSLRETGLREIGIESTFKGHEQVVLCGDHTTICSDMTLFANVEGNCCNPEGNRLLYGPSKTEHDDFRHEQNLIIQEEGKSVLFAGCAHRGIINILRKAEEILGHAPTHVLAGMHLVKSGLKEQEENAFIQELCSHLQSYTETMFFTMHCTGTDQYHKMKAFLGEQISYLSCGEELII